MRALVILFIILMLNVSMSFVVHASKENGVSGSYNNVMIDTMNTQRNNTYVPLYSELEQIQSTFSKVQSLFSMLTFEWLYNYIPGGSEGIFKSPMDLVVNGLNAVLAFFTIVAMIELWTKRSVI